MTFMALNVAGHASTVSAHPRRRKLQALIVLMFVTILLVLFDAGTGQLGLLSLFSQPGPKLHISTPICGTWDLKPEPFSGFMSEMELTGIAASPSGSIWVVGQETNSFGDGYHPAMAHWEGNRWRMIGLPDVRSEKAYLASAHFVTDTDGWAVGHSLSPGPGIIVMHWNGWNWSLSPSPPVLGALYEVRALASDDVWAVGWQNLVQPMQMDPLVMHWDGAKWEAVSLPAAYARATLYDVLPIAKDNVWAVGGGPGDDRTTLDPLILHWDGRNWNSVPSPKQCSGDHVLVSLSATNANDIWAVGSCDEGNPVISQKFAEYWDGTSWTISPVANQEEKGGFLSSVVALSSTDVWSSGTHHYDGVTAFVQHWDGARWQSVGGPPVTWAPQTGMDFVSLSSNEFW